MENKNIILLKHHPMNVKYTNAFYTNQVDEPLDQYIIIDVTSRASKDKIFLENHPNFAKEISPFYIGPLISSDGVKANIFEIFWQCGKVYPCHDNKGKPNEDFFTWRNEFYSKKECSKDLMRHACKDLGYEHKDTLYFAYFDKDKNDYIPLNYVNARKKVYIPEYAKLIYNSESFKWIKSLVDDGKKIAIVDFDAYNYYSEKAMKKMYESYVNMCKREKKSCTLNETNFTSIKSIKDVINCSYLNAGHGVVIKMLLEGDILVKDDGRIIDPKELLKI